MYEWDDTKRKATVEKHGLDFVDAVEIFALPHLILVGKSEAEIRKIAIGKLDEIYIAVVFTMRMDVTRIITARRARRNEREAYETNVVGRHSGNEE